MTTRDATALTCRAHGIDESKVEPLALLADLMARAGFETAMHLAVEEYRKRHSGGCRKLSQGDECDCFLCAIERLVDKYWNEMGSNGT